MWPNHQSPEPAVGAGGNVERFRLRSFSASPHFNDAGGDANYEV